MNSYQQAFAKHTSILDIFDEIKEYKTTKQRGDAFEAFADFFFRTDERVKPYVKNVYAYWGESIIPHSVMEELELPPKDKGIDLLCETYKGTYWAVQVKFRSNPATNLKWGDELATFEALFLRIQTKNPKLLKRGILFTSTYDCPPEYNKHPLLSSFTHSDILSSQNFLQALSQKFNYARHLPLSSSTKSPRPYQQRIIDKTTEFYKNNHRGKLILPCGAGKSLTSVWMLKEYIDNNLASHPFVLVVLPTLDLVGQYMHTFLMHYPHTKGFRWETLVVASEIGKYDQHYYTISIKDEEWKKYVRENKTSPKIVFATSKSVPLFYHFCQKQKLCLDFVVVDEAHMSVGDKTKTINCLIDPEQEVSKKFLFMTATEKILQNDNSEDIIAVNCMSNREIYGDYIENIDFRTLYNKGIELGTPYLCDYEILCNIGQRNFYNPQNYVLTKTAQKDALTLTQSYLACLGLIHDAFENKQVSHVICYCSKVKDVNSLKKLAQDNIFDQDIKIFDITGSQPASRRKRILSEYSTCERAIIFNVRVLQCGVDLPITDGIAFCSEITSVVQIIQMVMRGSRLYPGKKDFKVIIPCLISEDREFVKQGIGSCQTIRRVLAAMTEEDAELREELICSYSNKTHTLQQRISTKVFNVLPEINVEEWLSKFTTNVITSPQLADIHWEYKYNLLREYIERYKELPKRSTTYKGVKLGGWIHNQRTNYKKKKLSSQRIQLLESLYIFP
jgi:predicted helicase